MASLSIASSFICVLRAIENLVCGGEDVRFSAHGLDDNPYDGGFRDVLVLQEMILRHELSDHCFQDSPLLDGLFHELSLSKTDDAFIDLTDSTPLFPDDLRSDLIHQEAHARIRLERFYLSPRLSTVKIDAALEE